MYEVTIKVFDGSKNPHPKKYKVEARTEQIAYSKVRAIVKAETGNDEVYTELIDVRKVA